MLKPAAEALCLHHGDADNTAAYHTFRAILLPVILSR